MDYLNIPNQFEYQHSLTIVKLLSKVLIISKLDKF